MRAVVLIVAAALSAAPLGVAAQDPPDNAAVTLAAVRQALGGDAALNAVTSIDVKGTLTRTTAQFSHDESVEYATVLPDRFVQLTESTSNLGPLGESSHRERSGFAGDDLILDSETDSPIPTPMVAAKAALTPQEIADKRAKNVTSHKHTFANFVLPLLGASPAAHPLTFTFVGRVAGPTGPADAIDATGPDGFVRHLFVDVQTHLIVGIAWMAKPVVTVSVSSSMTMRSSSSSGGGTVVSTSPPPVLPANPTKDLPEVQWQLTVADYRNTNGLNWPHRLTTEFDGKKWEDVKLGTYRVNSKINAAVFRPSK
jgi:hypothetical protein